MRSSPLPPCIRESMFTVRSPSRMTLMSRGSSQGLQSRPESQHSSVFRDTPVRAGCWSVNGFGTEPSVRSLKLRPGAAYHMPLMAMLHGVHPAVTVRLRSKRHRPEWTGRSGSVLLRCGHIIRAIIRECGVVSGTLGVE